jgi:hypothetical protein
MLQVYFPREGKPNYVPIMFHPASLEVKLLRLLLCIEYLIHNISNLKKKWSKGSTQTEKLHDHIEKGLFDLILV